MLGNKELGSGENRSHLINFLADGYLPVNKGNEFALKVAFEGVQMLNIYKIKVNKETQKNILNILEEYKLQDGKINFESIIKYFYNGSD